MRVSNADVLVAINAVVDQFDGAAAYIEIRTGTAPATVETAATGTLLATVTLATPAFGAAADQNPGGRAALLGVPLSDLAIDATGTAGYGRLFDNGSTAHWDFTVDDTGSPDMLVDNADFQVGAKFEIQSLGFNQAEG